jgi:hypothetical protein
MGRTGLTAEVDPSEWLTTGIYVIDQSSCQQGIVKAVLDSDKVQLRLVDDNTIVTVSAIDLEPVQPCKGESVKVLHGPHKGIQAKLVNQDGPDGILEKTGPDQSADKSANVIMVLLSYLAKYSV